MRILSWNVNGIKTLPSYHPWNALREYEKIIDALGADIVCIQETKITRKAMTKDLAVMNDFDGFFSFLRPPAGRHGTAIFTRRSAVVPIKAEEGLSSVLLPSSTTNQERIGGYPMLSDSDDWNYEDLLKLESEGRTTVVDCGMFVLINLYSPNLTNDERLKFKNDFNVLINTRVRNLIKLGREVIVVGDLNIVLHMQDTSEPQNISKDGDVAQFDAPEYRRWLQEFVGPTGPMIDIVRLLHPDRKGMYTCWDTKTEARKTNHGARIDYILLTPGLRPWVKDADIQATVPGSDHCPVFVDFHDEIEIEGRGKVRLWDEMNPKRAGGDMDPTKQPDAPPFATRYYTEHSSNQKMISSFFTKGALPKPITSTPPAAMNSSVNSSAISESQVGQNLSSKRKATSPDPPPPPPGSQPKLSGFFKPPPPPPPASISKALAKKKMKTIDPPPMKRKTAGSASPNVAGRTTSNVASDSIELLLSSDEEELSSSSSTQLGSTISRPSPAPKVRKPPQSENTMPSDAYDEQDLEAAYEAASSNSNQWNSIFAPKAAPLCDDHQEPARLYTVNKSGINKGRRFYLCPRPVGPGYDNGKRPKSTVNREMRCNFFQWETQVKRPAGIALDRSGKKSKS